MITDSLIFGGKERRFTEVVKGLKLLNFEIEVILLKNIVDYPTIYQYASKVHILERKIKKDPTIFLKIRKIYKDFKPDIIHSWGSMPSIYMLPTVWFNRTKFLNAMIADAVCPVFGKHWTRAKITFPFSDIILSNSYAGLRAFGADKSKKGRVIWNGYDFNRSFNADPQKVKDQFEITTPLVVGMVAIFHPRKDYVTFLNAAIEICEKNNNVTFVCVGGGPMEEECKSLVPHHLFNRQIKFLGFQKNVENIVSLFDIGVLTANDSIHQEGVSNSIVEYMAQGKPSIATNSGGSPEVIIDGETGFLIPPFDQKLLIEKLNILLDNDELRTSMGAKSHLRIKTHFSFENMINSTIEIYNELLNKK